MTTLLMDFIQSKIVGTITQVLTSIPGDPLKTQPVPELEVTLEGVVGDRHYGFTRPSGGREKNQYTRGTMIPNHRQWSAVSEEEMSEVATTMRLSSIPTGSIGANLLFCNIPDLSQLPPFTRLVIGKGQDVVLLVYEMNNPCDLPMPHIQDLANETPSKRFSVAARQKRGLVGWVEKAGVIRPKSEVFIWLPKAYPGIELSQWL